jgi:hypothetical protein
MRGNHNFIKRDIILEAMGATLNSVAPHLYTERNAVRIMQAGR